MLCFELHFRLQVASVPGKGICGRARDVCYYLLVRVSCRIAMGNLSLPLLSTLSIEEVNVGCTVKSNPRT